METADHRPEDWDVKDYDGWLFGLIAFAVTCGILFANPGPRTKYPWFLTAWVVVLIWCGIMHFLTDTASRYRRWKDRHHTH